MKDRSIQRGTALMALAALFSGSAAVHAAPIDITTLPGYQAVTANLSFSDTGWAGWSLPGTGKVVLGAKVISPGDSVSDFSVFKPVGPGTVTPFGHTYGANEYGFLFRDVRNSQPNPGVQIELYFADMMAGYTITESSALGFSSTGFGGWSAPSGVVSGGGFAFGNTSASAASSQFADGGSVWPHYTFGANEQGWVVQNGQAASTGDRVYVISFNAPAAAVPEPGSMALVGLALAGLGFARRRKAD